MWRATVLNAVKLGTYDSLKHKIIDDGYLKDGYACHFVASFCAGFFMSLATTPIDNVKTRIMIQKKGGVKYAGMFDCAKNMYRTEGGFPAFYGGFGPAWARFAPFTVI